MEGGMERDKSSKAFIGKRCMLKAKCDTPKQ